MLLKENSSIDIITTTGNDNLLIVTKGNDNNINFDTNITELVDNKVKQTNRKIPWVVANKSKNKGEYDLKTELGKYIKPAQHFKNNSLKNFGETDEAIKYIDYGTKQQRRH